MDSSVIVVNDLITLQDLLITTKESLQTMVRDITLYTWDLQMITIQSTTFTTHQCIVEDRLEVDKGFHVTTDQIKTNSVQTDPLWMSQAADLLKETVLLLAETFSSTTQAQINLCLVVSEETEEVEADSNKDAT